MLTCNSHFLHIFKVYRPCISVYTVCILSCFSTFESWKLLFRSVFSLSSIQISNLDPSVRLQPIYQHTTLHKICILLYTSSSNPCNNFFPALKLLVFRPCRLISRSSFLFNLYAGFEEVYNSKNTFWVFTAQQENATSWNGVQNGLERMISYAKKKNDHKD